MRNKKNTKRGAMLRLIRTLFQFYPVLLPVTLCCVIFNAFVSSIPAVFMQKIIAVVEDNWLTGTWGQAAGQIARYISILIVVYLVSLLAAFLYNLSLIHI